MRWSVTKLFFPNPKRVGFLQQANFKRTNSTTPLAKRSGLVCANSKHRILGHKISLRVKERKKERKKGAGEFGHRLAGLST